MNAQIKEQRGCDKPTQIPVWVIDEYKFFICPFKWVSPQISFWYKKYSLIKNNICLPLNYDFCNPKFIEAIDIYEYYLHQFTKDKIKNEEINKSFRQLKEAKQCRTKYNTA